jgi:hypothetical protein
MSCATNRPYHASRQSKTTTKDSQGLASPGYGSAASTDSDGPLVSASWRACYRLMADYAPSRFPLCLLPPLCARGGARCVLAVSTACFAQADRLLYAIQARRIRPPFCLGSRWLSSRMLFESAASIGVGCAAKAVPCTAARMARAQKQPDLRLRPLLGKKHTAKL